MGVAKKLSEYDFWLVVWIFFFPHILGIIIQLCVQINMSDHFNKQLPEPPNHQHSGWKWCRKARPIVSWVFTFLGSIGKKTQRQQEIAAESLLCSDIHVHSCSIFQVPKNCAVPLIHSCLYRFEDWSLRQIWLREERHSLRKCRGGELEIQHRKKWWLWRSNDHFTSIYNIYYIRIITCIYINIYIYII